MTAQLRAQVLHHLEALVGFDTTNPPRAIDQDGLFAYIQQALPDFTHTVWDHGEGRISLLSERGTPQLLFNFHVDTVPNTEAWTQDPFTLTVSAERATGLGACDIKGAAACMIAAVQATSGSAALLFTSDEEAGNSHCVRAFVDESNRYARVVVAEPTQAHIVRAHRGIVTGLVEFKGAAGHASAQSGIGDSALHQAIDWGHRALDWAQSLASEQYANLSGVRFNIGTLNGGVKANIIAPAAALRFGLRTLPGSSHPALISALTALTEAYPGATLTPAFVAPALTATSDALVDTLGGAVGPAVDFWTEAPLFAEAGCDVVVWGPGDIAQAHTADEWVALEQLDAMTAHYLRLLNDGST